MHLLLCLLYSCPYFVCDDTKMNDTGKKETFKQQKSNNTYTLHTHRKPICIRCCVSCWLCIFSLSLPLSSHLFLRLSHSVPWSPLFIIIIRFSLLFFLNLGTRLWLLPNRFTSTHNTQRVAFRRFFFMALCECFAISAWFSSQVRAILASIDMHHICVLV